jgi:hypothetical protein
MGSTIVGLATILGLGGWHLRIRRRPNWRYCPEGRFCITLGHAAVVIGVYWLTESTTGADWEWALGNFWAFAAMVSFVLGFNTLNGVAKQQQATSASLESIAGGSERPRRTATGRGSRV